MTSAFEEGSLNAKICFVGEAPSSIECKMQRPFVGPAGMLLNDMLQEAGIARSDCYITNVFEERTYKDKTDAVVFDERGTVLYGKRGFTEQGMDKVASCLERIARSKANVIVPLGGIALDLLYKDSRITKWRGSILSMSHTKRKLVPTFHPAFLLRGNMLHRYTVISDLRRILAESSSRTIELPKRTLLIDPVYPEVISWLKDASKAKKIAIDIECLNHHISCFSIATSPSMCMSIPIIDKRGNDRFNEGEESQIWHLVAKIMGDTRITKINQNILFDISFLFQQNNIYTKGPLGCTMIAHHILYPDFPKGLDFLCSTYTREPYYKDDGKLWSKPWVDMEKFWLYNAKDSATAFEIWEQLEEELKDGFQWTYDRTIALFDPLIYMMVHGIKIDIKRLEEQKQEAQERLNEKRLELRAVAEWDFNPGSPKQCQEYFYVTKGIKPYISIKTGNITTDDRSMARIYKRYNLKEAKLVQEIRGLDKLIGTYLDVKFDTDNRLRCSYNPRGTTTGRLSSSKTIFGTGLNFQNLDMDFKDFLGADQ